MALINCSECGKEISGKATACPHCGNPMPPASESSSASAQTGTYCKSCKQSVTPVVTSVGGGSCSVGKRETWKCPKCKSVLHKSGCFVATVTYGDEDIVEVRFLRTFRDEVLSISRFGRALIWLYYQVSPYLARAVEILFPLRLLSRRTLDLVVMLIERTTHLRRKSFRRPPP